jgi:ABC-type branched-subunit amino acid transport system permease subunit
MSLGHAAFFGLGACAVAILGAQTDVVTYTLRAVHEGVSLFQIHVTYEACAQTTPCTFGFASSLDHACSHGASL